MAHTRRRALRACRRWRRSPRSLNWARGSGRTRGLRARRGGRTAILEATRGGGSNMAEENWERGVIERLATEGLREMRRARRWGIFFKLSTLVLLFSALVVVVGTISESTRGCLDKCTALVELRGELDADGPVSADNVMAGLQAAFKSKGTQG